MKKIIKIDNHTINELSGEIEISDIEEYLAEIKTKGYTHIDIIYDEGYGEIDFIPYYNRFETDEECTSRKNKNKCITKSIVNRLLP